MATTHPDTNTSAAPAPVATDDAAPTEATPGKAGTAAKAPQHLPHQYRIRPPQNAGNAEPRKRTREVKPDKPKPKAKPAAKGKAGTTAKPASKPASEGKAAGKKPPPKSAAPKAKQAPLPPKKKDEPIKGELTGKSLANYLAVVAIVPKLPADALNANQVAAKLSEKAGKTVWPIPTKRYLETAVARGDVVKLADKGRALYHLPKAG